MSRFRMSGGIRPLPPYACMVCAETIYLYHRYGSRYVGQKKKEISVLTPVLRYLCLLQAYVIM